MVLHRHGLTRVMIREEEGPRNQVVAHRTSPTTKRNLVEVGVKARAPMEAGLRPASTSRHSSRTTRRRTKVGPYIHQCSRMLACCRAVLLHPRLFLRQQTSQNQCTRSRSGITSVSTCLSNQPDITPQQLIKLNGRQLDYPGPCLLSSPWRLGLSLNNMDPTPPLLMLLLCVHIALPSRVPRHSRLLPLLLMLLFARFKNMCNKILSSRGDFASTFFTLDF